MKILVTGTHFTPAVAVIGELRKFKNTEVVYVGRKSTQEGDKSLSRESQILPSLKVKFIPIITGRLQRAFTIYTVPSLLKIPLGFIHAFIILFKEKPDVILSFGGYISVPVVIIGWLFSIPIIIHEQTLISGLANKIASLFADKIAVSFPDLVRGEKVVFTGNPIRHEIVKKTLGAKLFHPPGGPIVLVTGGNQGAHAINIATEQCLSKLTKIAKVIHVTGDSKFKDFERLKSLQSENYAVRKWIGKEWADMLSKADLVVSRAGINTLSELSFLCKPALVIPIPHHNEQNKNAEYFASAGLAKILPQARLSSLFSEIKFMLGRLGQLKEKAKSAKKVVIVIPDAAKRLALETYLLGK